MDTGAKYFTHLNEDEARAYLDANFPTPEPATKINEDVMPGIKIDPKGIMSQWELFDHLIWRLVIATNPKRTEGSVWYARDGIHDKIRELWELIK